MAVKTPEEEKKLLENQAVQKQNTGYQSKWQDSVNSYINQIQNRKPFEYNVNEDALYNQYVDQYQQQGKMAMMDTMGQAAALTGGYGNSYAQSVGQQAYHGYLNQLNDVVPQLYSMALDRYMNEGNQLYDQLNLMQQQDDIDYGRYRDQLADQDDAYNKLVSLMTGYGYKPTEDEMAAAGMSDAHMRAILGLDKQKSSGRSSGGSYVASGNDSIDLDGIGLDGGTEDDESAFSRVTRNALSGRDAGASAADVERYVEAKRQQGEITAAEARSLKIMLQNPSFTY